MLRFHACPAINMTLRLSGALALLFGATLLAQPATTHAATLVVTSTIDELNSDGDCSLREAIKAANSDTAVDRCGKGSGLDTITLPAGTFKLTRTSAEYDENAGAVDDLDITSDLVINGAGAEATIIDGNHLIRVLDIVYPANVQLNKLTIANGGRDDDDGYTQSGGGIRTTGNLAVADSVIRDNSTAGTSGDEGLGGGIYNAGGVVSLTNTTVRNNFGGFEGGGIYTWDGMLTLTNSTISHNQAELTGGGITSRGASILIINTSTIDANQSTGDYGGGAGKGGGINSEFSATIRHSTISNNSADGGIASRGGVGGGINASGTLALIGSTVSGNVAGGAEEGWGGNGGGMNFSNGTLIVDNSTISGNIAEAVTDPQVASTGGRGGGVLLQSGSLMLNNATIAYNIARAGTTPSVGAGMVNAGGSVTLGNTILAANTGAGDCAGTLESNGYNLIQKLAGCTFNPRNGDLLSVDPVLGALKNNSGPTATHSLLYGSPAIDAGSPATPGYPINHKACQVGDQRGKPRPKDGNGDNVARCDIGALELQGPRKPD